MKLKFQIADGCTIENDVQGVKGAFALVAHLQEVFGVRKCGNCGSPHVKLRHRTPQGYEYYSVYCEDCHHELKFGQQRDTGKLFPKGWEPPHYKQNGESEQRQSSQPQYHYEQEAPPQRQTAPPVTDTEIPY